MAPPKQTTTETEVSLEGFELQDIAALEKVAEDRGISFDEACAQLLQEHARSLRNPQPKSLFRRLFGNRAAH
jgi:hypothetical protein